MTPPRTRLPWIAACVLVALVACGREVRHTPLPAGSTVLALGDSLTYGTGASSASSYPAVLAEITGWNVANAGVPGETAAAICRRLPALLDEHRPALVLVLAGGNDYLRRRPESDVREALAACHAHALRASVPMVLLPIPRLGLGGVANAPLYADLAQALRVPLVDAGLADLLADASMRADAVHLNDAGYRSMAMRVADGLAGLGLLRR